MQRDSKRNLSITLLTRWCLCEYDFCRRDFFEHADVGARMACRGTGGRGGPTGALTLWGNGWTSQRYREQFHIVMGDVDAQPFPSQRVRDLTIALAEQLKKIASMLLANIAPEAESARLVAEAEHGDPSVMDMFFYFNTPTIVALKDMDTPVEVLNMGDHVDPGLLTLKMCSSIPGLEVLIDDQWVSVEGCTANNDPRHLVVLGAEQLATLTNDAMVATRHRVVHATDGARVSLVFELRTHSDFL